MSLSQTPAIQSATSRP